MLLGNLQLGANISKFHFSFKESVRKKKSTLDRRAVDFFV